MRVPRAIVIVDPGNPRMILVLDDQLDRFGGVDRSLDRLLETVGDIRHDAVDPLDLRSRRQARSERWPVPPDRPHLALPVHAQTERIPETRRSPARLQRFVVFAGILRINQPIAATGDAFGWITVE